MNAISLISDENDDDALSENPPISMVHSLFSFFTKKEGDDLNNKIIHLEKLFKNKINKLEQQYLLDHKRIVKYEEQTKEQHKEIIYLINENIKLNDKINVLNVKINVLETKLNNKISKEEGEIIKNNFSKELESVGLFFSSLKGETPMNVNIGYK